jgi:hypothetical protein
MSKPLPYSDRQKQLFYPGHHVLFTETEDDFEDIYVQLNFLY